MISSSLGDQVISIIILYDNVVATALPFVTPKYYVIFIHTAIRIGFELPGYTYDEPVFEEPIDEFFPSPTGRPENGPIFLAKEGNVISEQTFLVSIQVTDSAPSGTVIQPATIEQDYHITGPVAGMMVTVTFNPCEQRTPFRFTLFNDTLSEGNEAFQAYLSPEDARIMPDGTIEVFPSSRSPEILSSELFVTIVDDDGKFKKICGYICSYTS